MMNKLWNVLDKKSATILDKEPKKKKTYEMATRGQKRARSSALVWITLGLVLICCVCDVTGASLDIRSMCQVDKNWKCMSKDVKQIPQQVVEVCQTCGSFWTNMPGLDLCCRCSEHVFSFCLDAIYGGRRK